MKSKIILLLLLLSFAAISAFPQAKKRDTLQWFVGHWLTKTTFKADSNYITGGGSVNTTITVSNNGSITVQSPETQQFNQQIDNGIAEIPTAENQLKQMLQPEGFNEYNLYTYSKNAMDSVKSYFTDLKIPTGSSQSQSSPPSAGSNFESSMGQWCQTQQATYNTIMQFYKAHKAVKNENYDYQAPPQADYFNCWGCNRDGQKAFEKQCNAYDSTFFEPEIGMVKGALSMMRNLAIVGRDGSTNSTNDQTIQNALDNLFKNSKSNPQGNGPCAYMSYGDLSQATGFLAERMVKKADQLLNDMKKAKNYNSYQPAIRCELKAFRSMVLLMGSTDQTNDSENAMMSRCLSLTQDLLGKIMDGAMKQHDLTYLADIPLICQLEREAQLLGAQDDPSFYTNLEKLTQFTLSLDMNVKVNLKGQVTQTAHLQGKAKMVLDLDSVSCIRITLSKTENGVFTANVLENSVTYPTCTPTYIGTNTYTTQSPQLILHMCKQGSVDTLTLGSFQPKPISDGLWKLPCGAVPPENLGINNLDQYFQDPNSQLKQAQNIKSNASAYQQQMTGMQAQMQQEAQQIRAAMATGGMNSPEAAAKIKEVMNMGNTLMQGSLVNLGRLIVPLALTGSGNSAYVVDQTVNAKQSDTYTQLNQLIEYGTLHIQLKFGWQ